MDWLVSGLENSHQSRLPMWILITQIYWKDILRLRKTGRRLVNALLGHLTTVSDFSCIRMSFYLQNYLLMTLFSQVHNDPDNDILVQLSSRLSLLLTSLMITNPESFISPTTWPKNREALFAAIPIDNDQLQNAYQIISLRNDRLAVLSDTSRPGSRQELIKLLDSTLKSPYNINLSVQSWMVSQDKSLIVLTLLEWATSAHRPGLFKIYVAVALLRSWSLLCHDTTAAVLEYVDSVPAGEVSRKKLVYLLVSELVRSGHFIVSRYIQWLIARGGVVESADIEAEGPCATRLLVELPVHSLTPSLRSLRSNLLRRAGSDGEDEATDMNTALSFVKQALGQPLDPSNPDLPTKPVPLSKLCRGISRSSRAYQTEIGAYLGTHPIGNADSLVTNFNTLRAILESAQDYTMLAEVLKNFSGVSHIDVLASCADTLCAHLGIFSALDVGKPLFDVLLDRLKAIRSDQRIEVRPLLASLANLARALPGLDETASNLRKELEESDRSTAINAWSPVSDNMSAGLPDAGGDLHEEIEKLLLSGTSVDPPTMDRLFRAVSGNLEACWSKSEEGQKQRASSTLLSKLRVFDPLRFDIHMTEWMSRVQKLSSRPRLSEIFPLLVSLECLGISKLLAFSLTDSRHQMDGQGTWMQEVLYLIMMPLTAQSTMLPDERYRFYIQQKAAQIEHPKELLTLVREALKEYCELRDRAGRTSLPLDSPRYQDNLLELLKPLVLDDAPAVAQVLGAKTLGPSVLALVEKITTKLLIPTGNSDTQISFDQVLELASEVTLPFCQIKLALGLVVNGSADMGDEDGSQGHLDSFAKAMDRAIDAKNIMWTSMLPCLNEEMTQHLKNRAQGRFLDLFPSSRTQSEINPTSDQAMQTAENLLSVIEAIMRNRPAPKTGQYTPAVVERLADMWEIIASRTEEKKPVCSAILNCWLPAMLRFIILHSATSEPMSALTPGNSTIRPPAMSANIEVRARTLIVLSGLLQELDTFSQPDDQLTNGLPGQIFDLALFLVDGLTDDARAQCARLLLSRDAGAFTYASTSDLRLRYLFSFPPPPGENLMLAHRDRTAGLTSSAARNLGAVSSATPDKLTPFIFRRWELLNEPTPNVGENDTSLSLTLFEAIKL
jgi:mediator of RNA polymerase II transcription subunit 12, fungi type